jgi:hypothetical protein
MGKPEQLLPAPDRVDVKQAKAQFLEWDGDGGRIPASCIETFLLAETGLLDHHQATTTWHLPIISAPISKCPVSMNHAC